MLELLLQLLKFHSCWKEKKVHVIAEGRPHLLAILQHVPPFRQTELTFADRPRLSLHSVWAHTAGLPIPLL